MLVSVRNLTKTFGGTRALDDVSLDIPAGAFFALLGPSGCGKTTLLRILGGFEFPTRGHVDIEGVDVSKVPPNRRPVNMVFQSYAVFPHLSVFDNVAYGLRVTGVAASEVDQRVADAIAMVRLDGLTARMPNELSGGQRQRVALARALVKRPKLLLLDEPLSALDKNLRESMQFELVRLQRDVGITFVIVTHDQEEALAMASHIAVMKDGRIEQLAFPQDLYERPANQFVATFIGAANILPCRVSSTRGQQAEVVLFDQPPIVVKRVDDDTTDGVICVRPERIRLLDPASPAREADIVLAGQIEQATYLGSRTMVHVRLAYGCHLRCHQPGEQAHRTAEDAAARACRVAIDPEDMLLVGP